METILACRKRKDRDISMLLGWGAVRISRIGIL